MKKLSMLLVALLSAAMMMGFVGCKQEDNTPTGPAVATTWEQTNGGTTLTLTAYSDNTWKLVASASGVSQEQAKGTYTGDTTKDGTIEVTITHQFADGQLKELTQSTKMTATISGKTLTVPGFGAFTRK